MGHKDEQRDQIVVASDTKFHVSTELLNLWVVGLQGSHVMSKHMSLSGGGGVPQFVLFQEYSARYAGMQMGAWTQEVYEDIHRNNVYPCLMELASSMSCQQ